MTSSFSTDPTLYLYTSLTAGSSHIITATSRLETILKANKIPFRAVDCATDEKARMLWGRRSKGRKLPGLVKFGTIVGDIEQIEEWNEYGELKEQIEGADEFGTLGASTVSANLAPEPPVATTNASTPQRSGPPSRASSESRHISITEPSKDKEKEAGSQKPTESPGNLIIRQLGAEAAAKASQKKAASSTAAKLPTKPPSTTDQTPVPAATKLSADAAVDSSDTVAEATAAKTPAQLVAEGAKRTSVDKIAESEGSPTSPASSSATSAAASGDEASTEAQLLELRRTSSIAKTKSKLSEATPAAESETVLEDPGSSKFPATEAAVPEEEVSPTYIHTGRKHRGSDIGEASPEEIRALERRMSIKEEDEEDEEDEEEDDDDDEEEDDDDDDDDEEDDDDDDDDDDKEEGKSGQVTGKGVSSTDKAEKEATKGEDIKKEDAKDVSKAGVSVGD